MDLSKVLVINRKVEINKVGETGSFKSQIQEVTEYNFAIQVPYAAGRSLPLHPGDRVEVQVFSEHERYLFSTQVIDRKRDSIPLYVLAAPTDIQRLQLRNYVRVPCAVEVSYQEITPEEVPHAHLVEPQKRGITVDLSGGGLQMVTREPLATETLLVIEINIKPRNEEEVKIAAVGRVKRCEPIRLGDLDRYAVGVFFESINERDRDRIVSFVFRKIREQRRVK